MVDLVLQKLARQASQFPLSLLSRATLQIVADKSAAQLVGSVPLAASLTVWMIWKLLMGAHLVHGGEDKVLHFLVHSSFTRVTFAI